MNRVTTLPLSGSLHANHGLPQPLIGIVVFLVLQIITIMGFCIATALRSIELTATDGWTIVGAGALLPAVTIIMLITARRHSLKVLLAQIASWPVVYAVAATNYHGPTMVLIISGAVLVSSILLLPSVRSFNRWLNDRSQPMIWANSEPVRAGQPDRALAWIGDAILVSMALLVFSTLSIPWWMLP